ncbi:MAG: hypothetical protein NTW23_00675 [Rhodoluna sp.]|nr:hypothetical protein [Rhodoluna sp.]
MSDELIAEESSENPSSKKTLFGPKSILIAAAILVVAVITGMFASGVFNFTDKKAKVNYENAMVPVMEEFVVWQGKFAETSNYSVSTWQVVFPDLLTELGSIQKRAEAITPGTDELKHAHKTYLEAIFQAQEALKALIVAVSYEDPEQIAYFGAKATPHTDAFNAKLSEYQLLLSLIEDQE